MRIFPRSDYMRLLTTGGRAMINYDTANIYGSLEMGSEGGSEYSKLQRRVGDTGAKLSELYYV